jgi:hypothetical protein
MKPGGGKTHKACAVLCLKGGVPPLFVARNGAGDEQVYLMTDEGGGPLGGAVIQSAGEPVVIDARLERWGDLSVLKVSDADVRR